MYRVYDLKDGVLSQDTYLEDEFGEVAVRCLGRASGSSTYPDGAVQFSLHCPDSVPVSTRIAEMYHFLSVFSLFDPQFNRKKDGFQEIVSQTPPEPWEKNS